MWKGEEARDACRRLIQREPTHGRPRVFRRTNSGSITYFLGFLVAMLAYALSRGSIQSKTHTISAIRDFSVSHMLTGPWRPPGARAASSPRTTSTYDGVVSGAFCLCGGDVCGGGCGGGTLALLRGPPIVSSSRRRVERFNIVGEILI